jgi:hypothetical protein
LAQASPPLHGPLVGGGIGPDLRGAAALFSPHHRAENQLIDSEMEQVGLQHPRSFGQLCGWTDIGIRVPMNTGEEIIQVPVLIWQKGWWCLSGVL